MAFDPDKYLEEIEAQASAQTTIPGADEFDPDAYLADLEAQIKQQTNPLEQAPIAGTQPISSTAQQTLPPEPPTEPPISGNELPAEPPKFGAEPIAPPKPIATERAITRLESPVPAQEPYRVGATGTWKPPSSAVTALVSGAKEIGVSGAEFFEKLFEQPKEYSGTTYGKGAQAVSDLFEKIGKSIEKSQTEYEQKTLQDAQETLLNPKGKNVEQLASAFTTNVLSSTPQTLLAIVPGVGQASMVFTESGRWAKQAEKYGIDDPDIVKKYMVGYGLPSGLIESYSDKLVAFGGKIPGVGKIISKAVKRASRPLFKKLTKFVLNALHTGAIEGGEEVAQDHWSDVVTTYALKAMADKYRREGNIEGLAKIAAGAQKFAQDKKNNPKLHSFILGALAGAGMGLPSNIINVARKDAGTTPNAGSKADWRTDRAPSAKEDIVRRAAEAEQQAGITPEGDKTLDDFGIKDQGGIADYYKKPESEQADIFNQLNAESRDRLMMGFPEDQIAKETKPDEGSPENKTADPFANITEEKDNLTKLPNQNTIRAQMNESLKDENSDKYMQLIMDIDFFKKINDVYGHDEGDKILRDVGQYIQDEFGDIDGAKIGRYGGEELAAVLPANNENVNKVRQFIGNFPNVIRTSDNQPVTISAGLSQGYQETERGQKRINADIALYQAKKEGRNGLFLDIRGQKIYFEGIDTGRKSYVRTHDIRALQELSGRLLKESKLSASERESVTRALQALTKETGQSVSEKPTEVTKESERTDETVGKSAADAQALLDRAKEINRIISRGIKPETHNTLRKELSSINKELLDKHRINPRTGKPVSEKTTKKKTEKEIRANQRKRAEEKYKASQQDYETKMELMRAVRRAKPESIKDIYGKGDIGKGKLSKFHIKPIHGEASPVGAYEAVADVLGLDANSSSDQEAIENGIREGVDFYLSGEYKKAPSLMRAIAEIRKKDKEADEEAAYLEKQQEEKARAKEREQEEKKKKETKLTPVGKNADGNDVFEDNNGVRHYVENGVKVSQPVSFVPGKDGPEIIAATPEELYVSGRHKFLDVNEINKISAELKEKNKSKEHKKKTIHHKNFDKLTAIVPSLFDIAEGDALHLKARGFMDFNINRLSGDLFSLSHNYVQNGDLMADPDMVVRINKKEGTVEAISYQNSSLGVYQEVYPEEGKVNAGLKRELNNFLKTWLSNIEKQGHKQQTTTKTDLPGVKKGTFSLIKELTSRLHNNESFDNPKLTKLADEAFGGSMARGTYDSRDMYDALEVAVNNYIRETNTRDVKALERLAEQLPNQTARTKEQVEFQQFSTPPALAMLAASALNIEKNDVVLEPSAGTGNLALWAKEKTENVYTNEVSDRRRALLEMQGYETTNVDAEFLDDVLRTDIKPSVIIMNPPFSATGGRVSRNSLEYGFRHLNQALRRLRPGGRLVAIMGQSAARTRPTAQKYWTNIEKKYNLLMNVGIPGEVYRKYGTTFGTQLIVIDKTGPTKNRAGVITYNVKNLEGAQNAVRNLPKRQKLEALGNDTGLLGISGGRGTEGNTVGTGHGGLGGEHGGRFVDLVGETGPAESVEDVRDDQPTDRYGVSDAERDIADEEHKESIRSGEWVDKYDGDRIAEDAGLKKERTTERRKTEASGKFVQYTPSKLRGGVKHPAKIVESASMAATEPPDIQYSVSLPPETITGGKLSNIQLEVVHYAGQRFNARLPGGYRAGFFIGDGTGVGKGREIAGILFDQWNKGIKKGLWVSVSRDLNEAARTDLNDIGAEEIPLKTVNDWKPKQAIDMKDGVLFATYESFVQRRNQIKNWIGKDCVIIFDEAHKAKNAVMSNNQDGTKRAQAVIDIQNEIPDARVVYSSATGATEVRNMAYMTRLGLWGEGTSFPGGFQEFLAEIEHGGIGAMEMVSRDLKSLGMYQSRSISFDGVDYEEKIHSITPEQNRIYEVASRAWQKIVEGMDAAFEITNTNSWGKGRKKALFWAACQRFFKQIITSMKVPSAIEATQKALDNGESVVLSLYGTGEARTKEMVQKATAQGVELEDLDFSPREVLANFIQKYFPTQMYKEIQLESGNVVKKPMTDDKGNPIESREAIEIKNRLLDELTDLHLPNNPLDQIVNHFGKENVAELTGRKKRLIRDAQGKVVYERRAPKGVSMKNVNKYEMDNFQDGRKRIAIISDAASTGISLHASNSRKNKQRRVHITLELRWSADSQMQDFGRTHRSAQSQPPRYVLLSSTIGGEKRFSSTIARRLSSLGALSKGQRDATGGGQLAKYNFYGAEGEAAVATTYEDILHGKEINGLKDGKQALRDMGILVDKGDGERIEDSDLGNIERFLNRILILEIDRQNAVFNAFMDNFARIIQVSKDNGTFDEGITDINGEAIRLKGEPDLVNEDEATGAKTYHYVIEVDTKTEPLTFESAKKTPTATFYYQKKSKNYVLAYEVAPHTDATTGKIINNMKLFGPAGTSRSMKKSEFDEKYIKAKENDAKRWWDEKVEQLPKTRTDDVHIIGGTILPLWKRLETGGGLGLKVIRTETDGGERIVGVMIPKSKLGTVLKAIGIRKAIMKPEEIFDGVLHSGFEVNLIGDLKIKKSRLRGEDAVEVSGVGYYSQNEMRTLGLIEESIDYKKRWFVPTDPDVGIPILSKLIEKYPAMEKNEYYSKEKPGAKKNLEQLDLLSETEFEDKRSSGQKAYDKAVREKVEEDKLSDRGVEGLPLFDKNVQDAMRVEQLRLFSRGAIQPGITKDVENISRDVLQQRLPGFSGAVEIRTGTLAEGYEARIQIAGDGSRAVITINEKLKPKRIKSVIAHEVIGHFGMRQIMQAYPEIENTLQHLYTLQDSVYKNVHKEYKAEIAEIAKTNPLAAENFAFNEWLARHVEFHELKTAKAKNRFLAAKIFYGVKNFLTKLIKKILHGLGLRNLTVQEQVDDILDIAMKALRKPGIRISNRTLRSIQSKVDLAYLELYKENPSTLGMKPVKISENEWGIEDKYGYVGERVFSDIAQAKAFIKKILKGRENREPIKTSYSKGSVDDFISDATDKVVRDAREGEKVSESEPTVKSVSETVEKQWNQSKGIGSEKFIDMAKRITHELLSQRKHYPELNSKTDGAVIDILRRAEAIPVSSKVAAMNILKAITANMNRADVDVLTRNIVLPDILKDIERGLYNDEEGNLIKQLPFGYESKEQIEADLKRFQDVAKSTPHIQEAIEYRNAFMRRLKQDLVFNGLLSEKTLKYDAYYHHQVLEHMRVGEYHGLGISPRDFRVKKAGWQRGRIGSARNFNTEYIEAEFEVVANALQKLHMLKAIEELRNETDIKGDLDAQAKEINLKNVYKKYGGMLGEDGKPIDPLKPFKKSIAIGMSRIRALTKEGKYEGREYDRWRDVVEQIENGKDEQSPRFFKFLNFLIKEKLPGFGPASGIFKAIHSRDQFIKSELGSKYVTWENLIPDDHEKWQPLKGRVKYEIFTDNIAEAVLLAQLEGKTEGAVNIKDIQVRKALAIGQKYTEWVIPKRLAETLDHWRDEYDSGKLMRLSQFLMTSWKQWILINPVRMLKYNINNMSGDLDIAFAYDPRILKYFIKAAKDAWVYMKTDVAQGDLYEAIQLGVIDTGMSVFEIPDISEEGIFKFISNQNGNLASKIWGQTGGNVWKGSKKLTNWRENILRLAAYRYFKDRLNRGDKGVYAASERSEIDAIKDNNHKAAKLTRELIGDYGNISKAGQYIRKHLIPFWSWMEINTPRYYRLLKNLPHEGESASTVRLAGMLGFKGARKLAKYYVLTHLLFFAVKLWNRIFFPDEEEELGDARHQLHIILGRRSDGTVRSLRFQGALSDALDWIGMSDYIEDIADIVTDKSDITSKAREKGWLPRKKGGSIIANIPATPPVNKIIQSANPFFKTGYEELTGMSIYPDIRDPRPIRDRGEHLARLFSMDKPYRFITGKPTRGLAKELESIVLYSSDPGETAYYDTMKKVRDFLEERGLGRGGFVPTEKANALYYYKKAIRMKDKEAATRYLNEYKRLGGTMKGMRQSIKLMHPLNGLPWYNKRVYEMTPRQRRLKADWNRKLTQQERRRIFRAIQWYRMTFRPRPRK